MLVGKDGGLSTGRFDRREQVPRPWQQRYIVQHGGIPVGLING